MEQHNLAAEVSRAKEAELLLSNPLLAAALESIKSEVVDEWGKCPIRDKEGKELLWQLYKTAERFENLLKGHIETGKLASDALRRIEQESLRQRALRKLKLA